MKIVKVIAEDWAQYSNTVEIVYPFQVSKAMVVGFVIKENDEKIVLAHQLFPRDDSVDDVRYVTVIPKKMIIEISELKEVTPGKP